MKNICFIAGTRPEVIKIAPVIRMFKKSGTGIYRTFLCLTGQHKSMAEQALNIFGLSADYNLDIMSENQTLNSISSKIFELLPPIIEKEKPDFIFIQGDTTSAAIAGLVGFNMRVPVGHIEAGLRTYNLEAPFPEELNRKLISCYCQYNFAPTANARNSLLKENCQPDSIYVTGNTIVDAIDLIQKEFNLSEVYHRMFNFTKKYILITLHRRESFGERFNNICRAIADVARKNQDLLFIYPVHLNPNVKKPVEHYLSHKENILLLEPIPYIEMLALIANCLFCVTDSGGLQEETPSFGKYTLVLREKTERVESVEMGISEITGTSYSKIVTSISSRINVALSESQPSSIFNPFGEGRASEIIYDTLNKYFSFND